MIIIAWYHHHHERGPIGSIRIESNRIESIRIELNRIESNRFESNRIESNRIDSIHRTQVVTLMIGTNDWKGIHHPPWGRASVPSHGLPQPPTPEWFEARERAISIEWWYEEDRLLPTTSNAADARDRFEATMRTLLARLREVRAPCAWPTPLTPHPSPPIHPSIVTS